MSYYLKENKKTHLSRIIFSLRSGTLNITHFLECSKYGKEKIEIDDIYSQNTENQFSIAERVEERMVKRTRKLEAGLDSPSPGSKAPTVVVEHYWNKIDR